MKAKEVQEIVKCLLDYDILNVSFPQEDCVDIDVKRNGHAYVFSYKIKEGKPVCVSVLNKVPLRQLLEDMMPSREDDLDPHLDNLYRRM